MKILLLGKDGQVGWELQRALAPLGELQAFGRDAADFERPTMLRTLVQQVAPDVIVNAAAYTAVDKAQSEPARAHQINADSVGILAQEAAARDAWLVHYSTDYVFDGRKAAPYVEDDPVGPLSVYGVTKLHGEQALRERNQRHLIFRTSWVYGMRGSNFAKTILRLAREREELSVVGDQYGAPTSAELLADVTALALHRVCRDPAGSHSLAGTYHLTAGGETTWCEYAQEVLSLALQNGASLKAAPERVRSIATEAYKVAAVRPKNSRLNCGRLRQTFGIHPPHWRHHVMRFVEELTSSGAL